MLRSFIGQIKGWLGIDDDVVAMALTIMALGAIAKIITVNLDVRT